MIAANLIIVGDNMHPMTFKEAIIVRSKLTGLAIKYKHRSVEIRRA